MIANTANGCQLMRHFHIGIKRNEYLNLNIKQNTSLPAASPKI